MICVSIPEMRGEPSRRTVAIVLCVWASRRSRTSRASAGAAVSNSLQVAMATACRRAGAVASEKSNAIKPRRATMHG